LFGVSPGGVGRLVAVMNSPFSYVAEKSLLEASRARRSRLLGGGFPIVSAGAREDQPPKGDHHPREIVTSCIAGNANREPE
jgi:hypothetical protein